MKWTKLERYRDISQAQDKNKFVLLQNCLQSKTTFLVFFSEFRFFFRSLPLQPSLSLSFYCLKKVASLVEEGVETNEVHSVDADKPPKRRRSRPLKSSNNNLPSSFFSWKSPIKEDERTGKGIEKEEKGKGTRLDKI